MLAMAIDDHGDGGAAPPGKRRVMRLPEAAGGRVRELREFRGMSQAELAEHLSVSETAVSRLETGVQRLTYDAMILIARALKVPVSELLHKEHRGATHSPLTTIPLVPASFVAGMSTEGLMSAARHWQGETINAPLELEGNYLAVEMGDDGLDRRYPVGCMLVFDPADTTPADGKHYILAVGGELIARAYTVHPSPRFVAQSVGVGRPDLVCSERPNAAVKGRIVQAIIRAP